jgi:glycerol uptake facilitator-like aquaporin
MNPAISFSMLINRRLSVKQFWLYLLGQCIGALLGSALVYVCYVDVLTAIDGGIRQTVGAQATAGIWATYPLPNIATGTALLDQIIGSFLFVIIVLAVCDKQHEDMSHALKSLMIGNALLIIGLAYGMNTGYAISKSLLPRRRALLIWRPGAVESQVHIMALSFHKAPSQILFYFEDPARDLMPRIFTWMAGWGSEVFTAYNYYFWIPLVGPFVGSLVAAFVYSFFISLQFDD